MMFRQIHEIVFSGNGGYDWETVYHMPLWLRKTTFNLLKEHYEKQNEENEKQKNLLNNKKNEVTRPNIASEPNYTTKVVKQ